MQPTVGGFVEFIVNIVQPPAPFDPTTSPFVPWSFNYAMEAINPQLLCMPIRTSGLWSLGTIAVYNLAADYLINIAQDPSNAPSYLDGLKYWAYLRKQFNIFSFVPGIVENASDQGTSAGYVIPKGLEDYTIANLQQLKTPYGRNYLSIAQSWGPTWGLS